MVGSETGHRDCDTRGSNRSKNQRRGRTPQINAKKEAVQKDATSKLSGAFKTKLTKQFNEAKKDLNVKNTGEPLVVDKNTKEMILKKNRDRGVKASALRASKKTSAEQEKILCNPFRWII